MLKTLPVSVSGGKKTLHAPLSRDEQMVTNSTQSNWEKVEISLDNLTDSVCMHRLKHYDGVFKLSMTHSPIILDLGATPTNLLDLCGCNNDIISSLIIEK